MTKKQSKSRYLLETHCSNHIFGCKGGVFFLERTKMASIIEKCLPALENSEASQKLKKPIKRHIEGNWRNLGLISPLRWHAGSSVNTAFTSHRIYHKYQQPNQGGGLGGGGHVSLRVLIASRLCGNFFFCLAPMSPTWHYELRTPRRLASRAINPQSTVQGNAN